MAQRLKQPRSPRPVSPPPRSIPRRYAPGVLAGTVALGLLLTALSGPAQATWRVPPNMPVAGPTVLSPVRPLVVRETPMRSVGFNDEVRAIAYSGSTVYVGGVFTRALSGGGSTTRAYVAAVDASSGQLRSWHPVLNGAVTAIAVSGGSVYLAGDFTRVNGQSRQHLAKVSGSSGALDGGFRHSISSAPKGLAAGNGRLYAVGSFGSVDGHSWPDAASFSLSSDAQDRNFRPRIEGGAVESVALTSSRVYLGGQFHRVNGSSAGQRLAAVTPSTGATVGSFAGGAQYAVHSVAVGPGGVYAAIGGPGGRLAFYPSGGGTFWSVTADGDVHNVGVLGNTVYAGGHYDHVCSTPRVANRNGDCLDGKMVRRKVFATDLSGHLLGWNPSADSPHGVLGLGVSDGRRALAVGGAFTRIGGISQPRFAQFTTS
ncbi:MAG: hypothetical protein WCA46_08020 [Actinocatenispora sp.]